MSFERPATVIETPPPEWPVAGPAVAKELEMFLPPEKFPAFWEWMGRLEKLADQLRDPEQVPPRG